MKNESSEGAPVGESLRKQVKNESSEGAPVGESLRKQVKNKRKPSTRYVLVRWENGMITIDTKAYVYGYWKQEIKRGEIVVLCDDQPKKVLEKMWALATEWDDE